MTTERKNKYSSITRKCFINAPFEQLEQGLLDIFLKYELQPEIGLEGACLWNSKTEDFTRLAGKLKEKKLSCTLHAPFYDLTPGGLDKNILEVSRKKLRRAFDMIEIFKPRSIVCHLGYQDNYHSYKMDEWLKTSIETWSVLIEIAEISGTPVMFENTYEPVPDIHLRLFEHLPGKNFGFCLDVGHLMAFAGSTWQVWLANLRPWLGQIHLHDNNGSRDEHLAMGQGRFDFTSLFDYLSDNNLSPLLTLEPHSEKDLWESLEMIRTQNLFGNAI